MALRTRIFLPSESGTTFGLGYVGNVNLFMSGAGGNGYGSGGTNPAKGGGSGAFTGWMNLAVNLSSNPLTLNIPAGGSATNCSLYIDINNSWSVGSGGNATVSATGAAGAVGSGNGIFSGTAQMSFAGAAGGNPTAACAAGGAGAAGPNGIGRAGGSGVAGSGGGGGGGSDGLSSTVGSATTTSAGGAGGQGPYGTGSGSAGSSGVAPSNAVSGTGAGGGGHHPNPSGTNRGGDGSSCQFWTDNSGGPNNGLTIGPGGGGGGGLNTGGNGGYGGGGGGGLYNGSGGGIGGSAYIVIQYDDGLDGTNKTTEASVSTGAIASGTATVAAAMAPGTGGLLVMYVISANQSVSAPSGWTFEGSNGTGTSAGTSSSYLAIFSRVSTGSDGATVADSGDHTGVLVQRFTHPDGVPSLSAITINNYGTVTTIDGENFYITTKANLIVRALTTNTDAASLASFSVVSTLGSGTYTTRANSGTTQGNGSTLAIATAEAANFSGPVCCTITKTSSTVATLGTIAIEPPYTEDSTIYGEVLTISTDSDDGFSDGSSYGPNGVVAGKDYAGVGNHRWLGLKFNNMPIDSSHKSIVSASLRLRASTTITRTGTNWGRIYADKVVNAPSWGNSSRPDQITKTTSYVPLQSSTVDGTILSHDVKDLVQELVDLPGYSLNDSIRFASDLTDADGYAMWYDINTDASKAAQLYLTYAAPPFSGGKTGSIIAGDYISSGYFGYLSGGVGTLTTEFAPSGFTTYAFIADYTILNWYINGDATSVLNGIPSVSINGTSFPIEDGPSYSGGFTMMTFTITGGAPMADGLPYTISWGDGGTGTPVPSSARFASSYI